MKKLGTAIFLLLVTCYLLLVTPSPAYAQECRPATTTRDAIDQINKCAIEKDVFDDKIFNLNQIAGTADSLYSLLIGRSLVHPETDQVTRGTGAVAASGRLIAVLYAQPPISGVKYMASEIQKFNIIQPVYAQESGVGFTLLEPVKDIWTVFRNASYVGFVIVFVIMGFMIMFRAHISPQAVATVQDSLPRIVIALILVTFSYAIAGLMIDIMFLLLNIAINLLKSAGLNIETADIVFNQSIFGVIFNSWQDIFTSVSDAVANLFDQAIDIWGLDKVVGFFGGTVIGIIAGIAVIFIAVRVFVMLLTAYVMIIILTMAAPFFFLIQALPGNNGAKEWFKQMAANVVVFPAVAIMIIFAGLLGGLESLGGSGTTQFTNEQIGQFPLLSGLIKADAIGKLIALGFILMTPSAAQMVKEFIGAKGPQFGGAGAAALGAAGGVITRPVGSAVSPITQAGRWRYGEAGARTIGRALPFGKKKGEEPGGEGGETETPGYVRRH